MNSNTTQKSGTQRIKDLQACLNKHGYTDDSGSALAVDGIIGPKTQQALQKFNTHQTHMNAPDSETRDIQIFLNDAGYKNADKTPLTIDGIHGPNTDNAINQFENDFLSQIVPNYTPKTVQTKVFPQVPNLSKVDTVSPDDYNATGFTGNSGQQQASDQPVAYSPPNTTKSAQSQPVPQPQQPPQPEPNRQPSSSSYTSGSTGSSANATSSNNAAAGTRIPGTQPATDPVTAQISTLYKQYAQVNKRTKTLQASADNYQKQADAIATDLPDMAQKVRAGLANQKDYNALVSQIQALRNQAESSRSLAQSYQNDSDTYRKGMDQLAAAQKPAPQEGSGLFDSPEEAAADFAKRAMPLTDKTSHEYSAIMTEVQVPEYKDGQMQMVPKYKYGDITSGEINTVVNNALAGLMTPSEGKKYLLHSHPDNTNYDPDHFSGLPYDPSDMGDASIPTLAGSQQYQLPQLLNNVLTNIEGMGNPITSAVLQALQNVTGKHLSGYDGIFLAAPTGKLYLYNGLGNNKSDNQASDYASLQALQPIDGINIPKTKGQWNGKTGEYTYYNNP